MDAEQTTNRIVVLGASGDLFGRYLLPALVQLTAAGHLQDPAVVGIDREHWDDDGFRSHAAARLGEHGAGLPAAARDAVLRDLTYVAGDASDPDALRTAAGDTEGPLVAYLALPPAAFGDAIEAISRARLASRTRVVVEKPFGTDLRAAQALNRALAEHFEEPRVFRMDHFLGMQTVQNVIGLRFANRILEPLWNAEHVAAVEVAWDETLTLEGRAGYYDETGALRDMIQNHLMQLLALVAMERPDALDAEGLQGAKAAVLADVAVPAKDDVPARSRRARYTAGRIGDRDVPDYTDEDGVEPDWGTETYAEVELRIDNDRWRGAVPFRLRTGKALRRDRREITLVFRPTESLPFCRQDCPPNRLVLAMDPDRMTLDVNLNGAGDPFGLTRAQLATELAPTELHAYARVLRGAFEGDPVLSIRGDEAERSWEIVEPVLDAWEAGDVPLERYPAGSGGP